MKNINLIIIFFIIALKSPGQDRSESKIQEQEISFGTFSTINESNRVNVNPTISGSLGDYYFENRYNYEAVNSASINVGKRIFKKIKHVEITPMGGLVFGSFSGATAELQTSVNFSKWTLLTDNQFSYEYARPDRSLYLNWTIVRYKLTNSVRIGFTTVLVKQVNQHIIFDKGVTAVILLQKWSLRFYAFNYETEKRYFWLGLSYPIKLKLNRD